MSAELHNIPPIYDESSRVLILGSFPSAASRKAGFYYAHPQNRFWRVMCLILNEPYRDEMTPDDKKSLLLRNHIALWDAAASCEVEGSSDASITAAVPNDIPMLLSAAPIEKIFANGATAYALYTRLIYPKTSVPAVKLPSTSPANAAWSLPRLTSSWSAAAAHSVRRHGFMLP